MTAQNLAALLTTLEEAAHAASTREEDYRREAAARFRTLEQERSFGFRRFNLMKPVIAAIATGKDEEEAIAKGSDAFMHELEWPDATEMQQEALAQFQPVILACWEAMEATDGTTSHDTKVVNALKQFETWFAENRNGPFLSLFQREMPELPLVEV